MFASISRSSSRARNSYICSSCLCSIVAPPIPLISRSFRDQSANIPLFAAAHTFSTSPASFEDQNATNSTHAVAKSADSKEAKSAPSDTSVRRPKKTTRKKASHARGPTMRKYDRDTLAIKQLREAMQNEEANAALGTTESRSAVKVTDEAKLLGGKSSKDTQPKTSKQDSSGKMALAGRKKKIKKTGNVVLASKLSSVEMSNDIVELATEVTPADSNPPIAEQKTNGRRGSIDKMPKKITKEMSQSSPKIKARLKQKAAAKLAKEAAAARKKPVMVRRIETGSKLETQEDPAIVFAEINAFTTGHGALEIDPLASTPIQTRQKLIELVQSGKLSGDQRLEGIKLLRRVLLAQQTTQAQAQPTSQTAVSSYEQGLKDALLGKGPSKAERNRTPPGPVQISKGVTEYEIETIDSDELHLVPLESDGIEVPRLAYGLDRVLFNPGVYQLQDPRSGTYNFDPYLQTIMPVQEFDFAALKQYVTSSRDKTLIGKAKDKGKKYTGSTSSMTSSLAHFHFLLSQWRPITTKNLSKMFPVDFQSFTALQRAPTAIFLRYRDGTYAIDADKQYDSGNILMMLGKSMEKLLTLSTDEFERFRKINSDQITEEERNAEEAFHYTTMGDFLMRSQLDAYDPRLPGTGMFDLKTRAVISVRMDAEQYEVGRGYQIRNRHGEWESYEREYFDMIRAAFLKYSLQVRMGRMDGIFVAFHNTARIFGFQYISLPEMDLALHGTEDTKIGDSEFKLSLSLLNRVLDRATAKFPGKSLRLHFETRDTVTPFMYIFAEPVSEERIDQIQATNKAKIDEFERKMLGLTKSEASAEERKAQWDNLRAEVKDSMDMDQESEVDAEGIEPGERTLSEQELGDNSDVSDSLKIREMPEEARNIPEVVTVFVGGGEETLDVVAKDDSMSMLQNIGSAPQTLTEEETEPRMENELLNATIDEKLSIEISQNSADRPKIVAKESTVENDESEGVEAVKGEAVRDKTVNITDSIVAPPEKPNHEAVEEVPKKEILGMTLTIRNKLDGAYIERPRRLDGGEKWEVEYGLEEIQHGRALGHYNACLQRRKKIFVKSIDLQADPWNDKFIETIKQLSHWGQKWRDEQDLKDRNTPIKTLFPVDGQIIRERSKSTPVAVEEGDEDETEDMEEIDEDEDVDEEDDEESSLVDQMEEELEELEESLAEEILVEHESEESQIDEELEEFEDHALEETQVENATVSEHVESEMTLPDFNETDAVKSGNVSSSQEGVVENNHIEKEESKN